MQRHHRVHDRVHDRVHVGGVLCHRGYQDLA
jgi:hypothetical protein